MGFKKFSLLIAVRTTFLMISLTAIVLLISTPGYHAATLLLAGLIIFQASEVFRFVSKTNSELARFLDAARYADFGQRFELKGMGAGFGELGLAFTDILKRFQDVRTGQEKQLRHLKAMVEHVPVPLMSVHQDGLVTLWNNSARRLFGTNHVTRLSDMAQFGEDFARHIAVIQAGERRLVTINVDDMEQQLTLSATQIIRPGSIERLISMQDIGSELDGVQLQAWQDLVRVLTHEIMNSITPVASLAKTAADLVEDAKSKVLDHPDVVEELDHVASAVSTVARRSDGLMQFVGSYRRLTRLPPPKKQEIKLGVFFKQVSTLAAQEWSDKNIKFNISVEPSALDVSADPDMIEQLLINLLLNAEQALSKTTNPEILLSAYLNKRGHVTIEVSDNGPGVPDDIANRIFVPFFTTKRDGSGVGLALTRQIMIAHGGNVKLKKSKNGGALFTLMF